MGVEKNYISIDLPPPNKGKFVIQPLTGKQIVDSIHKDFGISIVREGSIEPKLTDEEIEDMPYTLFQYLKTKICEISGYKLQKRFCTTEFKYEYLPDDENTKKLLEICSKVVKKYKLDPFIRRIVISGHFAKSVAKWNTYDITQDKFRWDELSDEEQEKLIKKNKLAEMSVGASGLNFDPTTHLFSTIIINAKNITDQDFEFIILHEIQHNLNVLINPDFTTYFDEKVLGTRIKQYKKEHKIEKLIHPGLAKEVIEIINEIFVENEMFKKRNIDFLKYANKKINLMLKLAKIYKEKSSDKKEKTQIGLAFYIIKSLLIISTPFEKNNLSVPTKVDKCLSHFSTKYKSMFESVIELLADLNIENVSIDQILEIILSLEFFDKEFTRISEVPKPPNN